MFKTNTLFIVQIGWRCSQAHTFNWLNITGTEELLPWFFFYSEPVSEEEGFSKIDKVDVQLVCDTPYKVSQAS